MKNLILVDISYVSFYRFFATIRWYSMAHAEEFAKYKADNKYDWCENKIFMEKYEKMYMESILKLVKKKIFNNSTIIFCMDSPKENLWRTQLSSTYKGDRADLSLKHDFKQVFSYTYTTMIPNIIKSNPTIHKIRIDEMEADDIIAIITMYMEEKHADVPIYLLSGDSDFLQLGRPNVIFINFKTKKSIILTKEEAYKALQSKIVLGDTSDNISSIFPQGKRIKKKTILESDENLKEYLNKNPEAKLIYEKNTKLIDFKFIPKKFINKAQKEFIIIVNLQTIN